MDMQTAIDEVIAATRVLRDATAKGITAATDAAALKEPYDRLIIARNRMVDCGSPLDARPSEYIAALTAAGEAMNAADDAAHAVTGAWVPSIEG